MQGFVGRALVIGLVWWGASLAQAQCPADEDVPPWQSLDSGVQGPGSTYAPGPGALALCSATDGFGDTTDQYRYAFQVRDQDFALRALVSSVDAGGSGGLVAVSPSVATWEAARVSVEVYVTPGGSAFLRSSIRREGEGGAVDPPVADLPVTLPVALEIVREGSQIRTGIEGGATHLTADVDPQGQLMGPMRIGIAQTSNEAGVTRTATFHRIRVSAPEPGAEIACVDPEAAFEGSPFEMHGINLDRIDGVRIGGVPVSFDAASPRRLVASAPAARSSFVHGPVEIAQNGRYRRVGTASLVGTPIRRGDVDEDGEVTTEDYRALCYHVYRRAELECSAAGDVDADGDRDADDVSRLQRYLMSGRGAPEAPFEEPGFVEGSLACGQPAAPEIHAIELADGSPIDRPIQEGDDLVILGVGLPTPERAVVRFGANEMIPSASSTSTRLAVRVGTVLEGGTQCPRIFDAEPAGTGETRFGAAFGVGDRSSLCIPFEAGRRATHLSARMVRGQLEIDVPRSVLRPGKLLRVSFSLHLPYVVGMTRGPRVGTFDFTVPNRSYEDALAALAGSISRAINGSSSDECGCELAPTDVVHLEKLILPPCHLLPEVPQPPTLPGLPTQVEATKMIWTEMDIFEPDIPGLPCDGEIDRELEPRRFFWCELEQLAEIQGLDAQCLHQGLPLWESYEPIIGYADSDPRERSTNDKRMLVDPLVRATLDDHYRSPCEMALRATQCAGLFLSWWMPPFPEGGRVLKTFWKPFSDLPASVDASTLYSYDPPGSEPRKYLVGMHVGYSVGGISHIQGDPSYFMWSTFWLSADGETHTKGGAPMSSVYSPHCTAGGGGDRPASLDGTPYADWKMCTDSREGEEACGNPWEPGECPEEGPTSCTGCHEDLGGTHWGGNQSSFNPDRLGIGWLARITTASQSAATACLVDVENDLGQFPAEWIPEVEGFEAEACAH